MIVDIQNTGSSGSGWSGYVLGRHGDREHAKLIVGDTVLGDKICDSVDYKSGNYVRFMISFSEEDGVTPELGRAIAKDFFKEFMHGFSEDEYHLDLVEHTDTKHIHYHGRIAKKNLLTGTQLKLYWHKSDLKYKKAVVAHIAEKWGVTIGTDHKRTIPDPQKRVEQINRWRADHGQKPFDLSKKKGRGEAEERISDYIAEMNMSGLINSLDDVKAELKAMGFEIAKVGHDKGKDFDYITIQNDTGKLRLKGDIYGERFYRYNQEDRSKAISSNRSLEAGRGSDQESGNDIADTLQRERKKRLKWIDKQYGGARKRAYERLQERVERSTKEQHKDTKSPTKSPSPYRPIDRRNPRNIGNSLLLQGQREDQPRRDRDSERRDKVVSDQREQGVKNDGTGTEAIRRVRAIRERARRRSREIEELSRELQTEHRASIEQLNRRVSIQIERADTKRQQQQRQLNSLLADAHRATEPNYQAIGETAKSRGHSREVEAHLIGIFRHFGKKFDRFKQRIDRANRNLFERVVNKVKDKAMQELNRFKTNINLAEFATAFGYYKDKEKSSINAPVMRHENGDKVVIGKDKADGHYIYFNPNNDSDNGSIIDFVKNRTGETLGHIRKRLRAWQHNPQPQENIPVKASTKNALRIASIWDRIKESDHCLAQYWGLDAQQNTRLAKLPNVKYSEKDRAFYFALSNTEGICGIERRTADEKHIIGGSEKGVFVTGKLREAPRIFVFESPVDMISHRAMGLHNVADYTVCTMGSVGESTAKSLEMIFSNNKDAEIVIAVDNDKGGSEITQKLAEIIAKVDGNADRAKRERPKGKDWNEDIKMQKQKQKTQSRGMGLSR